MKQHPRIWPNLPDKKITNYFIVPRHKKIISEIYKEVIGPLTLEQFNGKRKELHIENIQFTIVIKGIE